MQAGVGWPHQFGMLRLPNKELVQSNNSELRIESVLSCFEILSRGTNFKMGPRKNYKKHTTKLLSHFQETLLFGTVPSHKTWWPKRRSSTSKLTSTIYFRVNRPNRGSSSSHNETLNSKMTHLPLTVSKLSSHFFTTVIMWDKAPDVPNSYYGPFLRVFLLL